MSAREPALDTPGLDPQDWDQFRQLSHAALDEMLSFVADVRRRPVWMEPPAPVRDRFTAPVPPAPQDFGEVLQEFNELIRPYATGNLHPMFMGWVHGAGTPVGMVAEMLAAGLNANCGGRNHIGIDVERQITQWAREIFAFPDTASGLFVTGTSMANFLGLLVARDHALGSDVRRTGLGGHAQLCAYASRSAHGCIAQAMELAGIGSAHLRKISCDAAGALDTRELGEVLASDRAAGRRPFLLVGTAGSVNTGAIDSLAALRQVADEQRLWFHVDGAFGALGMLAPSLRPLLRGIEQADSIAFDFHKWGHVPYDAGFVLVRDGDAHRRAFAAQEAYLTRAEFGLAAGGVWPCDLGPDLSRGFRALKTWFTIKTFGSERLGAAIERCCRLARRLADAVHASEAFTLAAPVPLNIVCFSVRCRDADRINRRIVEHLHVTGQAAPSVTVLNGSAVIRCAINNHRTCETDIDRLVEALNGAFGAVAEAGHV